MKIFFSTLKLNERIYVSIMLINSAIKINIFQWVYLFTAVYFWLYKGPFTKKIDKSQMTNIKLINQLAIYIIQ